MEFRECSDPGVFWLLTRQRPWWSMARKRVGCMWRGHSWETKAYDLRYTRDSHWEHGSFVKIRTEEFRSFMAVECTHCGSRAGILRLQDKDEEMLWLDTR